MDMNKWIVLPGTRTNGLYYLEHEQHIKSYWHSSDAIQQQPGHQLINKCLVTIKSRARIFGRGTFLHETVRHKKMFISVRLGEVT